MSLTIIEGYVQDQASLDAFKTAITAVGTTTANEYDISKKVGRAAFKTAMEAVVPASGPSTVILFQMPRTHTEIALLIVSTAGVQAWVANYIRLSITDMVYVNLGYLST